MFGQNGGTITTGNFKCYFVNANWLVSTFITAEFIPWGTIDEKSFFILIKDWYRKDEIPLSKSMMTQFSDQCMRH